jgi:hypothetical protein
MSAGLGQAVRDEHLDDDVVQAWRRGIGGGLCADNVSNRSRAQLGR